LKQERDELRKALEASSTFSTIATTEPEVTPSKTTVSITAPKADRYIQDSEHQKSMIAVWEKTFVTAKEEKERLTDKEAKLNAQIYDITHNEKGLLTKTHRAPTPT
jgi:predicted Mrr-cat superfamily restriction endonuclease